MKMGFAFKGEVRRFTRRNKGQQGAEHDAMPRRVVLRQACVGRTGSAGDKPQRKHQPHQSLFRFWPGGGGGGGDGPGCSSKRRQ